MSEITSVTQEETVTPIEQEKRETGTGGEREREREGEEEAATRGWKGGNEMEREYTERTVHTCASEML